MRTNQTSTPKILNQAVSRTEERIKTLLDKNRNAEYKNERSVLDLYLALTQEKRVLKKLLAIRDAPLVRFM